MAKQKIHHHHKSFFILLFGVGTAVVFIVGIFVMGILSRQEYLAPDTRYKDIQSRVVKIENPLLHSTIEYPQTSNPAINAFIAQKIDNIVLPFAETVRSLATHRKASTQSVSYQIPHYSQDYLSIAVYIKQDLHRGKPTLTTDYWTFDRKTGSVVRLTDLFGQSADGVARTVIAVQNSVRQTAAKQHIILTNKQLASSISSEKLTNFTVAGEHTIEFPFGRGSVAPDSVGPVTVRVDTNALQLFLQNKTAQKLLRVAPIGSAPIDRDGDGIATGKCASQRCIALTFDDGPTRSTPQLLTTLKEHRARATFFVIGKRAKTLPDITKRIIDEGHQIGNHTWSHASLPSLKPVKMAEEINRTNVAIQKITGVSPHTLRPPYGSIDDATYDVLKQTNMSAVLWSIDTRDWSETDSGILCDRVVASAQPGSVIILHDGIAKSTKATNCILGRLEKKSYQFVTIDELFGDALQPGKGYFRAQ